MKRMQFVGRISLLLFHKPVAVFTIHTGLEADRYVPKAKSANRRGYELVVSFPRATSRRLSNFPRGAGRPVDVRLAPTEAERRPYRVRMSELNSLSKIWICPGFSKALHMSRSRSGFRRSMDFM